jgi:hypothetical protein
MISAPCSTGFVSSCPASRSRRAVSGRPRDPRERKTFRHPEVGDITLDCDALAVEGSALRLIVYTATPGSRDADTLRLLAAVGLQSFS